LEVRLRRKRKEGSIFFKTAARGIGTRREGRVAGVLEGCGKEKGRFQTDWRGKGRSRGKGFFLGVVPLEGRNTKRIRSTEQEEGILQADFRAIVSP